jgi:hypothetical protein
MFALAAGVALLWLAAALYVGYRDQAPILWGRVLLLVTAGYLGGAWAGVWPIDSATPAARWVLGWLGAWPQ